MQPVKQIALLLVKFDKKFFRIFRVVARITSTLVAIGIAIVTVLATLNIAAVSSPDYPYWVPVFGTASVVGTIFLGWIAPDLLERLNKKIVEWLSN